MVTGEVNVANGGTGLSSGTSGQFLKFTGSTTLASAAGGGVTGITHGDYRQPLRNLLVITISSNWARRTTLLFKSWYCYE